MRKIICTITFDTYTDKYAYCEDIVKALEEKGYAVVLESNLFNGAILKVCSKEGEGDD